MALFLLYVITKMGDAPAEDGVFTPEQIEEYQETFQIFDKDQDGKVSLHEMEALVVAVGFQPQNDELENICSRIDQTGTMKFKFDEFLKVLESLYQKINQEEILMTCFKVFVGDESRIRTLDHLIPILTTLGIPLTPDEVKQLLFNADPNGDEEVEVADFVQMILGNKEEEPA